MGTQNLSENPVPSIATKAIESIAGLTEAQKAELLAAQKEAFRAETSRRLSVLQGLISDDTKKALEEQSVALSSLIPENGIVDRAIDAGKAALGGAVDKVQEVWGNAVNTVQGAGKEVAPSTERIAQLPGDGAEVLSAAEKFAKDPWGTIREFFSVLKEAFTSFSFEPLIAFFNPLDIRKKMTEAVDFLGKQLDLSLANKESWREVLIDIREFREVKLEDLMNLKGKTPAEIISTLNLPSALAENDLKNFMESFFEEKNFAKIQELTGKSLDDLKAMKISQIFSLLQNK